MAVACNQGACTGNTITCTAPAANEAVSFSNSCGGFSSQVLWVFGVANADCRCSAAAFSGQIFTEFLGLADSASKCAQLLCQGGQTFQFTECRYRTRLLPQAHGMDLQ